MTSTSELFYNLLLMPVQYELTEISQTVINHNTVYQIHF